jgi:hypothetical protein
VQRWRTWRALATNRYTQRFASARPRRRPRSSWSRSAAPDADNARHGLDVLALPPRNTPTWSCASRTGRCARRREAREITTIRCWRNAGRRPLHAACFRATDTSTRTVILKFPKPVPARGNPAHRAAARGLDRQPGAQPFVTEAIEPPPSDAAAFTACCPAY